MTDSIKEVPKYAQGDTLDLISRAAVVAMLREERDRLDALCRECVAAQDCHVAHGMAMRFADLNADKELKARANAFGHAAHMVEMMT